jgi:hypothetical protein
MKKNYSKSIQLRCVVCGSADDFEFSEDKTYIKCRKCNREYPGGYNELVKLNKGHIDEEIEQVKAEIGREVKKELSEMLKTAFKGNKHFKVR